MLFFSKKTLPIDSPIIIMGRGHSGTRVIAWACHHLGINLGLTEEKLSGDAADTEFTKSIKKIVYNSIKGTEFKWSNREYKRFCNAVAKYHTNLSPSTPHWGWKFPETYLIGPYILKAFPDTKFIHFMRDGRDVSFKYHLTDKPNRPIGRKIIKATNTLHKAHHIQAATSWQYQVNMFDKFKEHIPLGNLLEMKFEDLCLNPEDTSQALINFIGIEMTGSCKQYLGNDINTAKVSEYKKQSPEEVAEVEKIIKVTLQKYKYL